MQLILGDCLERLKDIADVSVDMVLADLPYGTTENKWDIKIDLNALWEEIHRVTKRNAACCFFWQMPFSAELVMSNLKDFRYEWVWEKSQGTGFLNANRMPLKIHESMLIFYRNLPVYNPQKIHGRKPYSKSNTEHTSTNYHGKLLYHSENTDGSRYPTDVIRFSSVNCSKEPKLHPTQKPVPLLEYLIKTYTNEGDTVLDPCMGSGSVGVACVNTGRDFIGIEIDKEYYNVAVDRIRGAAVI